MAPRMPKRARYPVFVVGLAVTLFGGLAAHLGSTGAPATGAVVGVGFLLMVLSVAIR